MGRPAADDAVEALPHGRLRDPDRAGDVRVGTATVLAKQQEDGAVEIVEEAEADAYFASRPRVSQLGAWASKQSETLESREAFELGMAALEAEFAGREVPRPPRWTGLRVRPDRIEFWYGAQFRLHERWLYEFDLTGHCSKRMLYP